jgi:hypothetical protein
VVLRLQIQTVEVVQIQLLQELQHLLAAAVVD